MTTTPDTDTSRAFAAEWCEHYPLARGYARRLSGYNNAEADDVVAEATFRVLRRTNTAPGTIDNLRPYLLTTIRRVASDRHTRRRESPSADIDLFDRPVVEQAFDPEVEALQQALAALPPRWRDALVWTEVHQLSVGEVAELLGISRNAVSALCYRAREALRHRYLSVHLTRPRSDACRRAHEHMPSMARHTIKAGDTVSLSAHLATCEECRAAYRELEEIAARMPGLAGTRRQAG